VKLLTEERKEWLRRRAANELKRTQRCGGASFSSTPIRPKDPNPRFPLPHSSIVPAHQYVSRGARRKLYHFVRPPGVLSLRKNFVDTAGFFQHLRHQIYRDEVKQEYPRGIDFEALNEVSPAAALIMAAELYRWQLFAKRKLSAVHQDEWNPDVARIFQDMGLFDFLDTPNARASKSATGNSIEVLKYRVGSEVIGTTCDDLLSHLTEISGPLNAQNFIYDGLIEALKNSKQHAYSEPEEWFGVPAGTWFMSGSYDKEKKVLTAAVYDLGIGIPRTLPRATIWEFIRPVLQLGSSDDGQMIKAAMEYGRTRTHQPERGNGLPTMMRILDHHKGYLRIISGTGEAEYDSVKKTINSQNHNVSLGGTLIEWSISQ
jgi:hypothetical protein